MKLVLAIIGIICLGLEAFHVPPFAYVSWGWLGLMLCAIALFLPV